jgi:hypothetical protein
MDQTLTTLLQNAQNKYYDTNSKNVLFNKKNQKFDCAEAINQQFDIQQLINTSIFVIPNTNRIYMDYPVFKMYAHPDNYHLIVHHFLTIIYNLIMQYGEFEMHLNMNSFTVSAAERYLPLIKIYCDECMKDQSISRYDKMTVLYTYFTPSVMSNIIPIVAKVCEPSLLKKLTHYSKQESEALLKKLFVA